MTRTLNVLFNDKTKDYCLHFLRIKVNLCIDGMYQTFFLIR